MINRGTADDYQNVAKYELRLRKISNRMDEILAVIMQDNILREQTMSQTYPRPSISPINQLISSPPDVDQIAAAAQKEVDNIIAIAYLTRSQPLVVTADPTVTHTAHTAPPPITLVTIAVDHLDCGKLQCPAFLSFTMNTIEKSHPGITANPLLTVNTGNKGNVNSFITPTIATNCLNCQDNQNTVAFESHIPEANKQINAHLTEVANQGTTETTVTNCHDHPDPNRCQYNNQIDPNSIRVCTQANIIALTVTHTIPIITTPGKATLTGPATVVEQRGTLPNTAPNRTFGASGVTLPLMIHRI